MNKSATFGFNMALLLFAGYIGWPFDEVISKLPSFNISLSSLKPDTPQKPLAYVKALPGQVVASKQDMYVLPSSTDSFMLTKAKGLPLPPLTSGQKLVVLCSSGAQLSSTVGNKSPSFFVDRGVAYQVSSEPPKVSLVALKNLKFRMVSELWVQGQGFGFSKETSYYVSTGIGCSLPSISKHPQVLAEASKKTAASYAALSTVETMPSALIQVNVHDKNLLSEKNKLNAVLAYGLGLLTLGTTTDPSLEALKKVATLGKYLEDFPSVVPTEESLALMTNTVTMYENAARAHAAEAEQARKMREAVPVYKLHEAVDGQVPSTEAPPVMAGTSKPVSLPSKQVPSVSESLKQKPVLTEKVVIKYVPDPAIATQISKLSSSIIDMQKKMAVLEEENAQLRRKQAKLVEMAPLEPFKAANTSVLLSKPVLGAAPTKKEISVNENISAN